MNITKTIAFLVGVITSFTSCSDFLEENSQNLIYITKWQDLDELLIGGCYVPANATATFYAFANKGMFIHLPGDELEENNHALGGASQFDDHYYTFGYFTWQPRVGTKETFTDYYAENGCWTEFYKYINVANNVIESAKDLPENTDAEKEGKKKVVGEAHFIRAFLCWWLTNTYGQPYNPATADKELGVPLKTTQEVIDQKFQRNTLAECYDLIVSDLHEADNLLSQLTTKKKSIYRADKTAVHLLLSRVYLYMQDWKNAEKYARMTVEEHPELENLNTSSEKFMVAANPENIFSMGGDDICTIINSACQAYRISKEQYEMYGSNDRRKSSWFWNRGIFTGIIKHTDNPSYPSIASTSDSYYYYHYSIHTGYQSPVSSLFWLRSSEAYLNLAEALCYQNNDSEALRVLNDFRKARLFNGSQELSKAYSHEELVKEIRDEHRREFVMEGHRWFDLRRYRVCSVMPEKKSLTHTYTYYKERGSKDILYTHQYVLKEDDPSWTLPIPAEVLQFNTGMASNNNPAREYTVVNTPL
ncbi:MAG: RagB/SusD family nutrient uptake outer membrane protein [Prevotella sp.]|nr:RagB/SusD family nutrient uptake outer membrane protein [Prevotella sp.]